ncbi:unnamed protein product [Schistosoma mattheei]|uniref:Uncharacterized protein n=1 Tax=Schistosoma mattheei TaxID=31246 RepID=A0A183Q1U9_9TREM|nr:unnamed protein product [Schistosoma mattheei]
MAFKANGTEFESQSEHQLSEMQNVAKLDMVLQSLPKIAAEISSPLTKCDKVTMICTGEGDIGVSKLTGELFTIMNSLPNLIHTMTGLDIYKNIKTI